MSEAEKNNLPEQVEKNKKEVSKGKQWVIGIILGVIESLSIYASSIKYAFVDRLTEMYLQNEALVKFLGFIDKYKTYLFLVVFLIIMLSIKGIETKRGTNLTTVRKGLMVGMVPGLIVFVILALTSGAVSCA